MRLKPTKNRIVIKPIDNATVSLGGIFIPEMAQENTMEAEVISLGGREKFDVKVGDKILFDKFTGQEVYEDGVLYLLIKETDIFGVIERGEA